MWFKQFFRLLYIAYLDCESWVKVVCTIAILMGTGVYAEMLVFTWLVEQTTANAEILSVIYYVAVISLWDIFLALFIFLIMGNLLLLTVSMLKVAYIYDNYSWDSVKLVRGFAISAKHSVSNFFENIGKQMDIDSELHDVQLEEHNAMIVAEIKKMKEKLG